MMVAIVSIINCHIDIVIDSLILNYTDRSTMTLAINSIIFCHTESFIDSLKTAIISIA